MEKSWKVIFNLLARKIYFKFINKRIQLNCIYHGGLMTLFRIFKNPSLKNASNGEVVDQPYFWLKSSKKIKTIENDLNGSKTWHRNTEKRFDNVSLRHEEIELSDPDSLKDRLISIL